MDDNGTLQRAISRVCERRDELRLIWSSICPQCFGPLGWESRPWFRHGQKWLCECGVEGWLYELPLAVTPPRTVLMVGDGPHIEAGVADAFALDALASTSGNTPQVATAKRVLWQYTHAAELVATRGQTVTA